MPEEPLSPPGGAYALVDSGGGEKLERFGDVLLRRPSPQVLWPRSLPPEVWQGAWASYHRSRTGGGRWEPHRPLPQTWMNQIGDLRFLLKLTGFGHIGVFPEQQPFWTWIEARCRSVATGPKVLNLFAYTGGSSMAAARAGAEVTHCDASKGVVGWASENARLNGLADRSIRWIIDDVHKFLRRERRRGNHYDAIILDPPSFGRGPRGEVWKLEEGLGSLLDHCVALLSGEPCFVLLSAHTPGLGPLALRNLLRAALAQRRDLRSGPGGIRQGEMSIVPKGPGDVLPSGTWAAWSAAKDPDWDSLHPTPLPTDRDRGR